MQHYFGATLWKGRPKFAEDPLPAMPSQEPQRTAEAVRRALPDLLRAKPLRSPRRHAQRPRHPLDRKESTYSENLLRLCLHFCKTNPFVVGFSGAYPLRVAVCLQPTRPKLTDLTRDIPIDVNDPGLDIAVERQIGALRRGSAEHKLSFGLRGLLMKPQLRDRSFRSPRPSRVPQASRARIALPS